MSIFLISIYLVCGIFLILNFKPDIHMLQQNSYRISRYWRWLEHGNFLPMRKVAVIALIFLALSTLLNPPLRALLIALICVIECWTILKEKHKKPLVFTPRVKRIYAVTSLLALIPYILLIIFVGKSNDMVGFYPGPTFVLSVMLLITVVSYLFVIAAVWLLRPVEKHINNGYINDAKRILKSMPDLKVIGITGSYGKTSTKHYLQSILSEHFETLMTPGSYNTPMGVVRTVREMMKPYTEVFICEMGAKQKGDIKEICDIVDPQCGIITAVGPMHLETFGNLETVRDTKFELADAIPADGFIVVNDDFPPVASRSVDNTECIRYAVSAKASADYTAEDIEYSPDGTRFTVVSPTGERLSFTTRLVGDCNISNLLAAIIVALKLGMPHDKIRTGVSRIEQVEHRLNVKRTPGGVTIIDDAFNSNPVGSRMALEVLGRFRNGRRICVTPGMIELADKAEELNEQLGRHIAGNADIAIIVNEVNRAALVKGILDEGFDKANLHTVADFAEAQRLLSGLLRNGDTVLYENDLPDSIK